MGRTARTFTPRLTAVCGVCQERVNVEVVLNADCKSGHRCIRCRTFDNGSSRLLTDFRVRIRSGD